MAKAHKLASNSYWSELIAIISELYEQGASLIPLGGPSGKRPLVKFGGRSRLPFNDVCKILSKNNSLTYGIRLHNLVVVDIDELDPNVEAKMLEIFGPTKTSVLTSRGKHLYYSNKANLKIKLPAGINKVDLKYGTNSFVVGPYSIRPDGQKYLPEKEEFSLKKLSSIKSISAAQSEVGNKNFHILEGTRNKYLCHKAIEFVSYVDTSDELLANLKYERDNVCENSSSVSDRELNKIVKWAWEKRLSNQVYSNLNSVFKIDRASYHCINQHPNGRAASELYLLLVDKHGHIAGKTFCLNIKALVKDDCIHAGEKALASGIKALLELGYLRMVKNYSVGHHGRKFQLCRPIEQTTDVRE